MEIEFTEKDADVSSRIMTQEFLHGMYFFLDCKPVSEKFWDNFLVNLGNNLEDSFVDDFLGICHVLLGFQIYVQSGFFRFFFQTYYAFYLTYSKKFLS